MIKLWLYTERGSTDRLACYAAWFLDGRSAGCLSWLCQTQHPTRASTRAAGYRTTCGTDGGACPADTPGLPQSSYTSHSWGGRNKFDFFSGQKAISVLWTAQQANFLLTDCFVQDFSNTSVVTEAHESPAGYFFMTKSQVIYKSLGMASGLKSTLNKPKQVPARLDALSTINPKRHSRLLLTSWHGYTSWRRRCTGSPSCPLLPLESPGKSNVWHQYRQRAHCVQSLT